MERKLINKTPVLEQSLSPRWVVKAAQARAAARSNNRRTVWIVRSKFANRVVKELSWPQKRAGYAVILGQPRPQVLPALMRRFERVAYSPTTKSFLRREELNEVLQSEDRSDRFIGGTVDRNTRTVTLWRGDLTSFVVPFSAFTPTANGIRPDWSRFSVTDYGHTLRFGNYEAASDALLYEYDPDFRRRLNEQRRQEERTLGASIRRLRKQRQLTRTAFPGIDPKTLARIERGQVERPHDHTLRIIAEKLGVPAEELDSY